MAHWFHRNPLKASQVKFDTIKYVVPDKEAIRISSELRQARDNLIQLLPDPHHELSRVETAANAYFSVLRGFLEGPGGTGPSKLRHAVAFRWKHSSLPKNDPEMQRDAVFEIANLLMNLAFWHMKHAAMIAAKDDMENEEAKDIHTSLRKAAGLIEFVKDTLLPQLIEKSSDGSDLDSRVIGAYLNQCTAEAQEVTIARAIEFKYSPALISALANETSKMYTTAGDALNTLDTKFFGHWAAYLKFKSAFYQAYAFNYQGDNLLSLDKCGDAIRSLREAKKFYEEATELSKVYANTKGPGTQAKPQQHLFFKKLSPIVDRTLEKCERENSLIYHEKVPFDPIELELQDKTYGLVSPEKYSLPELSPLWTGASYAAFDVPTEKEQKKTESQMKDDIKPVKEVEIKQSEKDPSNVSGCSVS